MIFTLFNLLKGRFSKEAIQEAKSSEKRMSRQEALQQMRNIASKRIEKK
jgi:type II secretory pathway component PulJ